MSGPTRPGAAWECVSLLLTFPIKTVDLHAGDTAVLLTLSISIAHIYIYIYMQGMRPSLQMPPTKQAV